MTLSHVVRWAESGITSDWAEDASATLQVGPSFIRIACRDEGARRLVNETYAAFAVPADAAHQWDDFALEPARPSGWLVRTPSGAHGTVASAEAGVIVLFDRLVTHIVGRLHAAGIYAIHAGAVADDTGAIVIAGRSGQGKTTLTLGLLSRGLGLLSDELALVDPVARSVRAYRRSVHVRPGTLPLLPALEILESRPRAELGGGSEWAVTPDEVSRILSGIANLPDTAPLRAVIVLDGTPDAGRQPVLEPVEPAVATLELLRGTWAASVDFGGTMRALGTSLAGIPCARLRVGRFDATLDAVLAWRAGHGG